MASYTGVIKARTIEVKFALAGKVTRVNKFTGDNVNKGDLLASLDRKILQAELDKELADYEKVRADFEIFNQKNPSPVEAIDKYLKTEKQAALNASVKEVELAKAKLDQVDLVSPVSGVVLNDSDLVTGLYVTPAGSPIKIVDSSSYYFEFQIEEKDVLDFMSPKNGEVEILGKKLSGATKPVMSDGKNFLVRMQIADSNGLLMGLTGQTNF